MTELNMVYGAKAPLLTPTQPFDFANPPLDPMELSRVMLKAMAEAPGLGLAANQLGLPYSMFVMRGKKIDFAVFNPKIVGLSDELVTLEEGCLSFPGLVVKIERPRNIRVRFQTPEEGIVTTLNLTDMDARIFQHEYEHLQGKLFYNSASRVRRDIALRKWRNKR